jgi:hypothetical protein
LTVFGVLALGVGGWASTTALSGALIASGSIVVDSSVKKVQHPTGGVVGELRVRDGDRVQAGDIVARLDQTVTRSNLAIITKGLDELFGSPNSPILLSISRDSFATSLLRSILIYLNNFWLSLGDLTPGLGHGGDQLGEFALHSRRLALQLRKTTQLNQILFEQVAHAVELTRYQLDFPFLGSLLGSHSVDLFTELPGLLAQLRLLPQSRRPAQLEQLAFAIHDLCDVRVVCAARQQIREHDHLRGVPFARETRLS